MLTALLITCLSAAGPTSAPPRVMFLPIGARGSVPPEVAQALTEALLVQAGKQQAFAVMGLKEVETTMAHEQLKQVAACESESCALQIAGALNVDQLVFGALTSLGDQLVLTLTRVDARSAAVARRTLHRCPAARPTEFLDQMPAITAELLSDARQSAVQQEPVPPANRATSLRHPLAPPTPSMPEDTRPADSESPAGVIGRIAMWTGLGGVALGVLLLSPPVVGGIAALLFAMAGASQPTASTQAATSRQATYARIILGSIALVLSVGSLALLGLDTAGLLGSAAIAVIGALVKSRASPGTDDAAIPAPPPHHPDASRSEGRKTRRSPRARKVPPRPEPGVAFCQSGLDCPGGGFCKDRGDSLKVCMRVNGGAHGDFCDSGLDCRAGAFCKPRGDGVNVCMTQNGGARGDPCDSGLDCRSGLWCKDRGDGLQTCM